MNSRNESVYEAMFDDLIREVFGFSFAPWFVRMLWDERYESYSIIEGNRMLSNVCIFKTDMTVCGHRIRAHQFGAVATRGAERGKGLSRLLMEHVLSRYPETPAYLAANPSVTNFYPRFGFRMIQTYRPELAAGIDNPAAKAVKLTPDDARIIKALRDRRNYSGLVDSLNTMSVQIFHLLTDYADGIYSLPESGAIVVAAQKGKKLFVADVIAEAPVTFEDIKREMPFTGIRHVEFGFCPDWLGVLPVWKPADINKKPFFIRGDWVLPEKFRFPILSET
jgi:GNAT superfamily N-acetyltransferase